MTLNGRNIGDSCRNWIFWDDGKCSVLFCCRHFLHFVYDLTVSWACLRHHSTRILMRKTVVPLDGRRIENSSRNWFFVAQVSVLFCPVAVTFYNSSMISPFLKLGLGINQRRTQFAMQWCYPIGAESKTRVAIGFLVRIVSVLVPSAVVTFYDLYMISPFLEHGFVRSLLWLGKGSLLLLSQSVINLCAIVRGWGRMASIANSNSCST